MTSDMSGALNAFRVTLKYLGWNMTPYNMLCEREALLMQLFDVLKDEWEHDMLVGDAGDILKKLGVVS